MKNIKSKLITVAALLVMAVMTAVAQPNGGGGRERQSPEQMAKTNVERLTEALDLDEKQQKAIYEITIESMSNGERPSREQMMKSREQLSLKIKEVLNEKQVAKYDEMEAKMKERQQQRGQ